MNINTGNYAHYSLDTVLGPDDVIVTGTDQQIEELSRRVKLGNAELERRKSRRKSQKKSRKNNR